MFVKCENCNAAGQASEEAEQRTVLWVCGHCDVRYLVSKRGMHRAPLPPKRKGTGDESGPAPLSLDIDAAHLKSLTPRVSPERAPSDASGAAVVAEDWLADLSPSDRAEAPISVPPPLSSSPLGGRATVYPVIDLPVRDPLFRRPALLASALAGLLVGLAAYGVKWTRENVGVETATAQTANLSQQLASETSSMTSARPAALEGGMSRIRETAPVSERLTASVAVEERPGKGAAITSVESAPPAVKAKTRPVKAPKATKIERRKIREPQPEAAVAAPIEPLLAPIEPPRPAEPPSLAEAMAIAAGSEPTEPRALAEPKAKASSAGKSLEGYTAFSRDEALSALSVASVGAARCRSSEGPFGLARVAVTFVSSGQATIAVIEGPPFAGTQVGSCIARAFREASVSPFSGAPVTVRKSIRIF